MPDTRKVLTRYVEYQAASPEWFQKEMETAVNQFDLAGLTNDRVQAVGISKDHPMVIATGAYFGAGSDAAAAREAVISILPACSVTLNTESNEIRVLGGGSLRDPTHIIDMECINTIRSKFPEMKDRRMEGLITDQQLSLIEGRLRSLAREKELELGAVALACDVSGWWMRESISFSMWTESMDEFLILHRIYRSAVFSLLPKMRERDLRDAFISSDPGLRNFNFGATLRGSETEMNYLNHFRNIVVFDELSIDRALPLVIYMELEPIPGGLISNEATGDWATTPVEGK